MKKVNPAFLEVLIWPVGGLADQDDNGGYDFELTDKQKTHRFIEKILLPHFLTLPAALQTDVKNSLAYFLKYGEVNYVDALSSNLVPFNLPKDCRFLFVWIWECFFPFETYQSINREEYVVDNAFVDFKSYYIN